VPENHPLLVCLRERWWSIVMSTSVCMSVCLSVCEYISRITRAIFTKFLCIFLMAMARFSTAGWRNSKERDNFGGFFTIVQHSIWDLYKNGRSDRDAVWDDDVGGSRYHVLDGGPDPPTERGNFEENVAVHCKIMRHITASCAKTAESIEMSFWVNTPVGPWNHVLYKGPDLPRARRNLGRLSVYSKALAIFAAAVAVASLQNRLPITSCNKRDHPVCQASANIILKISGRRRCGLSALKGWWDCTAREKSDIYDCLDVYQFWKVKKAENMNNATTRSIICACKLALMPDATWTGEKNPSPWFVVEICTGFHLISWNVGAVSCVVLLVRCRSFHFTRQMIVFLWLHHLRITLAPRLLCLS